MIVEYLDTSAEGMNFFTKHGLLTQAEGGI